MCNDCNIQLIENEDTMACSLGRLSYFNAPLKEPCQQSPWRRQLQPRQVGEEPGTEYVTPHQVLGDSGTTTRWLPGYQE